jgi:hypothetical protein
MGHLESCRTAPEVPLHIRQHLWQNAPASSKLTAKVTHNPSFGLFGLFGLSAKEFQNLMPLFLDGSGSKSDFSLLNPALVFMSNP